MTEDSSRYNMRVLLAYCEVVEKEPADLSDEERSLFKLKKKLPILQNDEKRIVAWEDYIAPLCGALAGYQSYYLTLLKSIGKSASLR